ncbi:hypothetical protein HPB47_006368 [Ixodes persulcatus]|uniref:Uncharacterized protein n=1 Tax=Ixodes persulcatus TaxID=34615 RepID=A0AC60PB26_IXOPE|nr:hypothetical protein HPB47_006368 [Ixodes persulcatus]
MWFCFPFCPPVPSGLYGVDDIPLSSDNGVITQEGDSYMLEEFSRDVDRRLVPFYPPVPELPRCSLCGMVPSKLYRADTCKHGPVLLLLPRTVGNGVPVRRRRPDLR